MYLVRWIVVGVIAGFVMSRVLPNSECGTPVDVVIGALGAVGAGAAMHAYGFGIAATLPVAVLGSLVLVFVIHLLSRSGSTTGKDIKKAA
jgi:uncharacterized membrane protein YeaQ/YmgE (transglycosylase-associated protein family)